MIRIASLILVVLIGSACTAHPGAPDLPTGGCPGLPFGLSPACSSHPPTAPPDALSEGAAVAAARLAAPSSRTDATVIWTAIAPDPFITSGAAERPLVWEVRLQATFAAPPCPTGFLEVVPTPSDPACLDQESGLVAVLDVHTGSLLGWIH